MAIRYGDGDIVVVRDTDEPGVVLYGERTGCGVPRYLVATLVRCEGGVTLTIKDRFEDELREPTVQPTKVNSPTVCALAERADELSKLLWPLMDWEQRDVDDAPSMFPTYIRTLSGKTLLRQIRRSMAGFYWAAASNGKAYQLDRSENGWRVTRIIERPAC